MLCEALVRSRVIPIRPRETPHYDWGISPTRSKDEAECEMASLGCVLVVQQEQWLPMVFHNLTKEALTVRKWRFHPGSRLGEPVRVRANVEVNFRLRN